MSSAIASDQRPLSLDEYKRYGRQMIMPNWGLPGELPPFTKNAGSLAALKVQDSSR